MYILLWYIPDNVFVLLFLLFAYVFSLWYICDLLVKLDNPEAIVKCIILTNGPIRFLFLPKLFLRELHIFPMRTFVLASLINVSGIIAIILQAASMLFELPGWLDDIGNVTTGILLIATLIEIFVLDSDVNSQKPPKPPKLPKDLR